MTKAVKQLLTSFDALSDAEKQEVTVEVFRRMRKRPSADLPDEAFVALAEELFLELDAREARDAKS
jgi:hypothetical protein